MNEKVKRYAYQYRYQLLIGSFCFILCTISLLFLFPKSKASSKQNIESVESIIEKQEEVKQETPVIRVDIKGAVSNPGVYEMKESARVNDVIYQAGGVLESADLSRINLSKHVTDEMVIIVYTKDEINTLNNPPKQIEYVYLEPECSCPDSVNDACISPKKETNSSNETQKISLNTASKEQLETLPGVGASKAEAIIEYRAEKKFEALEELKEIKGIGDAIFEKIKDYITL